MFTKRLRNYYSLLQLTCGNEYCNTVKVPKRIRVNNYHRFNLNEPVFPFRDLYAQCSYFFSFDFNLVFKCLFDNQYKIHDSLYIRLDISSDYV